MVCSYCYINAKLPRTAASGDREVFAWRGLAEAQVLTGGANAHRNEVFVERAERVMPGDPADVPESTAFVLEAAVLVGKRDRAVPRRPPEVDRDVEACFPRGFGNVDRNPALDGVGAGVGGQSRPEISILGAWRVGAVGVGIRHGVSPPLENPNPTVEGRDRPLGAFGTADLGVDFIAPAPLWAAAAR